MKILMMVLQFPPAHSGGAEMQCWKQAQALAARGHEVTILTEWLMGGSPRREIRDSVAIRRLGFFLPATTWMKRLHRWLRLKIAPPTADRPDPFSSDGFLSSETRQRKIRWMGVADWLGHASFLLEAMAWVKIGRPGIDVVHVHESHWLAGFGQWVGERRRAPVFCKEACGEVLLWKGGGAVPGVAQWRTRRDRCRFIAMTPHIRSELEKAGIASNRIWDVPNGVVMPDEAARPQENGAAIYAGNFSQGAVYKAFDVLLKAWGLAHREEPRMRLRLFGGGGMERWKQVAERDGCGQSVEFAGKTDDLQREFMKSGFLVLPSRVEGLSNVLLEAQALGLPAVVSAIGGNVAVVKDGENGLVVPVGDVDALAEAMLRLHRSASLRTELGRAARARIAETFEIGKVAARLETAYGQALAAERAAPRRVGFGG